METKRAIIGLLKTGMLAFVLLRMTHAEAQFFHDSLANRLYVEIKKERIIPNEFIGCYGYRSSVFQKVDSLRNIAGETKFITLINDKNYILRYWAYIALLQKNDSLAFEYLKVEINNDTVVTVQNAGNTISEEFKFNELLVAWYTWAITVKYKDGITSAINSIVIISDGKNLKKYKKLNYQLSKIIDNSNVHKPVKKINYL